MTSRTFACEDCGHPTQTIRENTKYCAVCRLIRDLPYVAKQHDKAKCALCTAEFARLDVRDPLCGDCTPPNTKHGIAECAFCKTEQPRFRPELSVCDRCARDPENRAKLWGSLKRKQADRRAGV